MDYKHINDYEQLYLIKENDDNAKELMFDKYKPIVISIASKYHSRLLTLGVDIDDLIQEGYIGLSNAFKSFKESSNACFYTFSVICIERQVRAYCKKQFSNKNRIINSAYSIDELKPEDGDYSYIYIKEDENSIANPDIYVSNLYNYIKCINFKNTLPIKESMIFELRFNGFKYREIAMLLNISCNNVDNSIHRIKEKFKVYLNK